MGSEPELRTTPTNRSVLTFSAASSIGFGDRKKTLWLLVTYWNNPEKVKSYITKGSELVVSGELSQHEYQAKDGTTKTSMELNATFIDLVSGKKQDSQPAQPQQTPQSADNFDDFDQDIPF